MKNTLNISKLTTYMVIYEVWFGPKKKSERQIKSFSAESQSPDDISFKVAENEAREFFKKKEKEGMHVDVVFENKTIHTERVCLTSK